MADTTTSTNHSQLLWDSWNGEGVPRYPSEKVIQFALRNFGADRRPVTRTLDLGCGNGANTCFLALEGFDVVGVDFSRVALANAASRLESAGLKAELVQASVDEIDFEAGSFDLVICTGVLECTGKEVARKTVVLVSEILAKGGRAMFLFASDKDFRITEGMDESLGLYGYSREEVDELFAGCFVKVDVDRNITTFGGGKMEQNEWLVTVTA